jgi:hypothetical protein
MKRHLHAAKMPRSESSFKIFYLFGSFAQRVSFDSYQMRGLAKNLRT